jgi:hypothetical protein
MGWHQIPMTQAQIDSQSKMMGWLNQDINYPTQGVAPLSDMEKTNLANISGSLERGYGIKNLATEELRKTLAGEYDPMTSPYWSSYRNEMTSLKQGDVAGQNRANQAGGMGNSTTGTLASDEVANRWNQQMATTAGGLMQQERQNRLATAGQVNQTEFQNQLAGQQALGLPRQISQAEQTAQYQQQVNDLLAPYIYQSPLAQYIMNQQSFYYKQSSGGFNFGSLIGPAIGIGASLLTGGLAAGSGGFTAGTGMTGGWGLGSAAGSASNGWMSSIGAGAFG